MPWKLPTWDQINAGVETAMAITGTESSKWRALQGHVNRLDNIRNAWSSNSSPMVTDCYAICKGIQNNESKDSLLIKVDNLRHKIENM